MTNLILFGLLFNLLVSHHAAAQSETKVTKQTPESVLNKARRIASEQIAVIESRPRAPSLLDERSKAEQTLEQVPFAIYQHQQNYLLPITYVKNPNAAGQGDLTQSNIDNHEAKFQISIKIPIYSFGDTNTGWYFGFTSKSFWQVYNDEVSKPFRETNYEPELMYRWQADYSFLNYRFNAIEVSLNHQSNGQSGLNSRSWNRVILTALFSDINSAYYVRTWYRLPEDDKTDINDASGDDNPNILDFVGRVELGYAWQFTPKHKLIARLRNNLQSDNNRGSVELNYTYNFTERYDVLIQYFNGYGDSLIDYNRHQERIGLGLQLKFL
jgi:phospholipase A1